MRFVKRATVNASADKVWSVFAHDFEGAHKWMASVPHSYGKPNGTLFEGAESAGRVCELDSNPKGMKASEQFLAYDEAAKRATVRVDFVNTPFLFPVDHNAVEVTIVDVGENQSEMTWAFSSQLKPLGFLMWPLIRIGFSVFVGQIIGELKFFVENGTPHPRKIKATSKLKLAASA